jgi:hypothetical protein
MLDLARLKMVRHLSGGAVIAQCPACAAAGGDSGGQHLRMAADGAFCCVVNPGPAGAAHRKEVWRAAGVRVKRPAPPLIWRLKR